MREERFFIETVGESLNSIIGHPKGHLIHRSMKRKVAKAVEACGVRHMEKFATPVEIWFFPFVTRGRSGRMLKRYDAINFATSYKAIEDCLVQAGILEDDSPDWVQSVHCMAAQPAGHRDPGVWVVVREAGQMPQILDQQELELPSEPAF